jgi:SAM-dependent methyltransferase
MERRMMSLVDDITEYYAARASVYDETAGYTSPEAERLRVPIKTRYQRLFTGCTVLEIACGTGYWTPTVAEVAEAVVGIDINPSLIAQAEARCKHMANVRFLIADAYTLNGVPGGFSAAFAHWWWSHIPLECLCGFLTALHSKLQSGAQVLFVDQLPYAGHIRRKDAAGNTIEDRLLPDGRSFEIVKNFPSEEDVRNVLTGIADNLKYTEQPEEGSWSVTYRKR